MVEPVLAVEAVDAGYPGKQILSGVSFDVAAGEVVSLLGANGSGKSTILSVVSGFVRPWRGSVRFAGRSIGGHKPYAIFRAGVAQVSQARDLFGDMSVEDNLRLGAARRGQAGRAAALEECFALFPRLAERRTQRVRLMSGGEQQMVAIGRALMSRPTLLLLDEPSGGLAPRFVAEIGEAMLRLRAGGMTMLLVEQNIKLALSVADRFLVLRDGAVADRGDLRAGGASEEEIVRSVYL
jgi:branched-chain amino acid transport system ATP-binding protein